MVQVQCKSSFKIIYGILAKLNELAKVQESLNIVGGRKTHLLGKRQTRGDKVRSNVWMKSYRRSIKEQKKVCLLYTSPSPRDS